MTCSQKQIEGMACLAPKTSKLPRRKAAWNDYYLSVLLSMLRDVIQSLDQPASLMGGPGGDVGRVQTAHLLACSRYGIGGQARAAQETR